MQRKKADEQVAGMKVRTSLKRKHSLVMPWLCLCQGCAAACWKHLQQAKETSGMGSPGQQKARCLGRKREKALKKSLCRLLGWADGLDSYVQLRTRFKSEFAPGPGSRAAAWPH